MLHALAHDNRGRPIQDFGSQLLRAPKRTLRRCQPDFLDGFAQLNAEMTACRERPHHIERFAGVRSRVQEPARVVPATDDEFIDHVLDARAVGSDDAHQFAVYSALYRRFELHEAL